MSPQPDDAIIRSANAATSWRFGLEEGGGVVNFGKFLLSDK